MEKERQEKRTKWQRGTRGGNREKIDATREIKWETRKTRGNYFLFLYLKKKKAHGLVFHFVLSVH